MVGDSAQRVGQLQLGESAIVETMRPDASDGRWQGEAGEGGATLERRLGQRRHGIGRAVVLNRLRDGDRAAVGCGLQIVVSQHFDRLARCDTIGNSARLEVLGIGCRWKKHRKECHQKVGFDTFHHGWGVIRLNKNDVLLQI